MSELDVIRLMMAIGVLLLMAASAAFGMLWQRQQNLVAALRPALGPLDTPAAAAGNPAGLAANVRVTAPLEADRIPVARADSREPAPTTEAARYQAMLESARARVAAERANPAQSGYAAVHVGAVLGSTRPAAPQPAGMASEEDRLRALLAGRAGRQEGTMRGGSGREPRLW